MIFWAAYGPQVGRSPPLVLLVTATHSGNPAYGPITVLRIKFKLGVERKNDTKLSIGPSYL